MEHLVHLIKDIGYYGYIILFFIIFFESFPLTFYLPGDSLLFTTGFLASQEYFSIAILIPTLYIGSILGYNFSYFMGERLRNFILKSEDRYWFKKKHLEYTQAFFDKYGDKTIIIGRFVPIVRSFAPTLAGAAQMPFKKFSLDSIVGGFAWVLGVTFLGYYLGRVLPGAGKYLTPIIIMIVLISLSPSVYEYFKPRNKMHMKTKELMNDPIPVGLYIDKLNSSLKQEKARIVGEVSGVQMYEGRSYLYFNIKDTKEEGTLKCFMWKRDFSLSGVALKDGLEVIVTAYPSIYKPNGGLTMQIESVELVGEGALKIAYDQLKAKLEKEGLFSVTRKREIPMYPHKIGVITSKSGAVINDFLTNIGKFGYEIFFVDSKVEGVDAIKDLLGAVNTLKSKDIDVLVIMRGGGSLESFQAFNNEVLVKAIAGFPVPVLTGIGHDKDEPLVAMVSDKNVSTPTAVANLLNSTWGEALSLVRLGEERIFSKFQAVLRENQSAVDNSMVHMESGIKRVSDRVSSIGVEILRGFSEMMTKSLEFLVQSKKLLDISNPERQLAYGYSIVSIKGKIVKSVKDVKTGDELDIAVNDGIINSQII